MGRQNTAFNSNELQFKAMKDSKCDTDSVRSTISASTSQFCGAATVPMGRRLSMSSMSTSSSTSSARERVSSSRIRSQYLQRLGVLKSHAPSSSTSNPNSRGPAHTELLKADLSKKDSSLTRTSPPQFSRYNPSAKARFSPCVTVNTIPNKCDYTKEERDNMWMSADQLDDSVERNCLEFASELYDWQNAVEEREFVCIQGRKVHPAHAYVYQQELHKYNTNRQFCMILSAQQQQQQSFYEQSQYCQY